MTCPHLAKARRLDAYQSRAANLIDFAMMDDDQRKLERLERNYTARDRQIDDLLCRHITGRSLKVFFGDVGGNYRPTIDSSRYDAWAIARFVALFEQRFRRSPHVH